MNESASIETMPIDDRTSPVLVEVTRGGVVESRHRGRIAVADPTGRLVDAWGDIDAPVFPRSAVKPLQAIAVVESGAAEAYAVTPSELALAAASHSGEPRHVTLVEGWLARLGLGEKDLECGAQRPLHRPAAEALAAQGRPATALHNNCSGKHAGMLTLARHLGVATKGYARRDHAVQRCVTRVLEEMCEVSLEHAPCGIDGCSIPAFAIPLAALARGMARFAAAGKRLGAVRADACRRIAAAMASEPFLVAGSGRYCTEIIVATGGRALVKTGAEGVFCAALPERGLGVALKCEDGASRAAQATMTALLVRLGVLEAAAARRLAHPLPAPIRNRRGRIVGQLRVMPALLGSA